MSQVQSWIQLVTYLPCHTFWNRGWWTAKKYQILWVYYRSEQSIPNSGVPSFLSTSVHHQGSSERGEGEGGGNTSLRSLKLLTSFHSNHVTFDIIKLPVNYLFTEKLLEGLCNQSLNEGSPLYMQFLKPAWMLQINESQYVSNNSVTSSAVDVERMYHRNWMTSNLGELCETWCYRSVSMVTRTLVCTVYGKMYTVPSVEWPSYYLAFHWLVPSKQWHSSWEILPGKPLK